MTGYLVEYEEKKSLFFESEPGDNFSEMKNLVVSNEDLAKMLTSWKYLVFRANIIDTNNYTRNQGNTTIKI